MFNGLLQSQEQKLILTQSMRQSLEMLQMPLPELKSYIQEEMLSNPLLELEDASRSMPQSEDFGPESGDVYCTHDDFYASRWDPSDSTRDIFDTIASPEADDSQQLRDQLLGMRLLDERTRCLCLYLIECLDERGYLNFTTAELARECGTDEFTMTQALYVLQGLEPAGVGARSLEECLILQLAQTDSFSARTVRIVKDGLPLLARNDIAALAALLGCGKDDALAAANCVRQLNPIPFRGYGTAERTGYQIPEAYITCRNDTLQVEWNRSFLPKLIILPETAALLRSGGSKEELQYLNEKLSDAKKLIRAVENRSATLQRILQLILRRQRAYFTGKGNLHPMTMGQLADELSLNISTVSRALQGKYISFNGQNLPIKKLFVNTIEAKNGAVFSGNDVKHQIRLIVQAEDRANPLSDQAICIVLEAKGLAVSRRTVAKYREELDIPSSARRRQK